VGGATVKSYGGRVHLVPVLQGYSTRAIVSRVNQRAEVLTTKTQRHQNQLAGGS
jgi:hypothetical protein